MGDASGPSSAGVTYPFKAPAPGAACDIAPGVMWCRLPGAAGGPSANAYALADGDGWILIDSGFAGSDTRAAWEALLSGPLGGKPVRGVVCTSPDAASVGGAGWLCAHASAPLTMAPLAYLSARARQAESGAESDAARHAFAASLGVADAGVSSDWPGFAYPAQSVEPLPGATTHLQDGEETAFGDGVWRIVVGGGVATGATSMWSPALGLFLTGAQIASEAPGDVAVTPREPDEDVLGAYMAALWRIMAVIPDDVTVAPLVGEPFRGLHARIDALIAEEEARLETVATAMGGAAASDVAARLGFAGPAGAARARAYLNHLAHKGAARADGGDGAALRYHSQASATAA